MRIPRRLVGTPLLPILPHAASTLPTPLPPRIILCRTLLLRRFRLYDVLAPTANEDTGRGCGPGLDGLELDLFLAFDVCATVD